MKLEDQVVRVELGKELNALGVKQDSTWVWVKGVNDKYGLVLEWDVDLRNETYSAFTVAELGEMLPALIVRDMNYYLHIIKTKKTKYYNQPDYYIVYADISNSHYIHSERDDKEADARAKMLIYLIKEQIIKVGEVGK